MSEREDDVKARVVKEITKEMLIDKILEWADMRAEEAHREIKDLASKLIKKKPL